MRFVVSSLAAALLLLLADAPAALAQSSPTIDRIVERGQVNLGIRKDRVPLSFEDDQGRYGGYTVDLCVAIVDGLRDVLKRPELGVHFLPVTAQDRFDKLESGEIDLLCGATTKTIGRQQRIDFTDLTFITGTTVLSLAGKALEGVAALDGKTIAVVQDTTTLEVVRNRMTEAGLSGTITPVATSAEGLQAVLDGKADGYAADQVILIGLVLTHSNPQQFAIANELLSYEPLAIGLPRGDPDFRLVANAVLANLARSRQIFSVYDRWLGQFAKQPPELLRALFTLNAIPK